MLRMEKNLTQEQMGEKLNLSTSAYCKIEYGETDLTLTRPVSYTHLDVYKRQVHNKPNTHCHFVWWIPGEVTMSIGFIMN